MKKQELAENMKRMDEIVSAARHKFSRGSRVAGDGEPVDWANPLEELIAREEMAIEDAQVRALEVIGGETIEKLPEALQRRIREIVFDEFRSYEETLMEWLFAAGPHPLEVIRRLFAYAKMKRASLLWNMGFRQIGPLLKETGAAMQWRCRMLFGDTPAGWSKPAGAVEKMRAAQKKNLNRLGGKKCAGFGKR